MSTLSGVTSTSAEEEGWNTLYIPFFLSVAYLFLIMSALFFQVSLLSTEAKIDGLAIILSTPFTFLAWGILTFLVAVITYSFFGFQSTSDGRNIPVRGSGSILIIILGGLVVAAVLLSFIFFRSFRKNGTSV